MSLLAVAAAHHAQQAALVRRIAQRIAAIWAGLDSNNLDRSWTRASGEALATVVGAQILAAAAGDSYVTAALTAQGIDGSPAGEVLARAFGGAASDGRSLETLLREPVISVKEVIARGASTDRAMTAGGMRMDTIVRTQIADAGRAATGVAIAQDRAVGGYIRMLSPPSCSRCAILAGKHFRWNKGFDRHPNCDCVHIPAGEDIPHDPRTSPAAYFRSLSQQEQDRIFTRAGAQAVRDGGDINQVVNVRRGATGLTPAGARITEQERQTLTGGGQRGHLQPSTIGGRQVFLTREGVTRRGSTVAAGRKVRLMPESIYQIAGEDRAEAIRLLRAHGYIT